MAVNKKGVFFTLAAIGLAIIIMLSFNVYNDYRLKDEMEVIEIRVSTMNDFVKDMEDDIGNAIFIAGFRSLLSLEDYMMKYDDFIDNLGTARDAAFDEVFRKGTVTGTSGTEKMGLMGNNTFLNWTDRMKAQANRIGIELDFTINAGDVTISHIDPWIVEVSVDLIINVEDEKGTASWRIDKTYKGRINITGTGKFVDPLYLVKNNGLINNTIRKTTVSDFSGSNLATHLNNNYYIENSDAPSYLMRFENDLGSSANGIESLANVNEISSAGLGPSGKTAVDYLYFDSGSSTTSCRIEGMEVSHPWFYLDYLPDPPNHLAFYGRICDVP